MSPTFRRVWHQRWPTFILAATFLVVVILFAVFLQGQQDRQRQGTCAVLDRVPARIDSGVDRARSLYDCGPPKPPILFFGHPFPKPTPTAKPHSAHSSGSGGSTTVVVVPAQPSSSPSRKATHHHKPASHPSTKPSPKPTPSPTCVASVGNLCIPKVLQN